jgi:hypothetical protein
MASTPPSSDGGSTTWRERRVYRVPGSTAVTSAAHFARLIPFSRDREFARRYFYFGWEYPHHSEIARVFETLWTLYEAGGE